MTVGISAMMMIRLRTRIGESRIDEGYMIMLMTGMMTTVIALL